MSCRKYILACHMYKTSPKLISTLYETFPRQTKELMTPFYDTSVAYFTSHTTLFSLNPCDS